MTSSVAVLKIRGKTVPETLLYGYILVSSHMGLEWHEGE